MRTRRTGWRHIGAVLMFRGEASFSARQGAANNNDRPTQGRPTMTAEELLELLLEDEPDPAA